MPDYGRPVEFGFFPEPVAADVRHIFDRVALAERLGLDLIGIQDHPYQRRFLDTWALLANLAARTSRVRLFADVACLPLRPPAMLARAAASIDVLSEGRFEVGVGAGAFWDAIAAMGGPRRTPREAREALAEAIAVMRLMWSGERGLRYEGRHYRLDGIHSGPVPVHPIEIWVGGGGPRMLELIGRAADGWLPSSPSVSPEALADRHARIDAAAATAGRPPSSIRRLYNVNGRIAEASTGFLQGPVEQWVDEITELAVERGVDTFILWASDPVHEQLERFAGEIVPAVREAVASVRLRSRPNEALTERQGPI